MSTPPSPSVPARAAHRIALLLAKHGEELARHIRRIVRDDDTAQDLLQETMIRAYQALGRLTEGANERAWLYRIATNASLNHQRSRARERAALARHAAELTAADPEDGSRGDEDERAGLWAEVARLPERQRLALSLRVADELGYEEIAARIGGTAAAARANVYQATRRLKLKVREVET
jgi:RNA polymerase sigma-70 factor (ECF subfamily)